MTEEIIVSPVLSPIKPRWQRRALILIRFVVGYFVAVAAGALVLAVLLRTLSNFSVQGPMHGRIADLFGNIFGVAATSFELGAFFGLPYTVIGSLIFWFLLPRRAPLFLLIGMFCPIAALLTMSLAFQKIVGLESAIVLSSLPAGLVAAYLFGAIAFGQGFRNWRFG